MPRALRPLMPGGIYHVASRGNRRQDIFLAGLDRKRFLEELVDVIDRCEWRCYAYSLMGNHFHLIVETLQPNISTGMQLLKGNYAKWFNRRHACDGHLFQGRFFSELLETDWHLLELSRYVVLNPVRAGLCRGASDWRWSSYRATAGLDPRPDFLAAGRVLSQFGRDPRDARRAYVQFVREGLLIRRW